MNSQEILTEIVRAQRPNAQSIAAAETEGRVVALSFSESGTRFYYEVPCLLLENVPTNQIARKLVEEDIRRLGKSRSEHKDHPVSAL